MSRKIFTAIVLATVLTSVGVHAQTLFTDNFNPQSALWSNSSGNWTASNGDYYATVPNNNPYATTLLPFVFTNANDQITVTVNNLGDGGVIFEAPNGTNSVFLVTGGWGYGLGFRGGLAGTSAYWAIPGNPPYALVSPVFTPGNTYTLTVAVDGGAFSAFIDPDGQYDGNSQLLTSLNYPSLGNFMVGLYDAQPDTTTGSGFGLPQSFSNFSVSGVTLPEPETYMLMLTGLGLMGLFRHRKCGKPA